MNLIISVAKRFNDFSSFQNKICFIICMYYIIIHHKDLAIYDKLSVYLCDIVLYQKTRFGLSFIITPILLIILFNFF